jgi:hypothetical protein
MKRPYCRAMRVAAVVGILGWCRLMSAAIAIPGGLVYPSVPGQMAVYDLVPDAATRARVSNALARPVPIIAGPLGDVSIFIPIPLTAPNTLSNADQEKAVVAAFFQQVLPSLPADGVTRFEVGQRFTVARQEVQRDAMAAGNMIEDLALVRADRYLGERRVYGSGSVAVAEVRGGQITAVVVRWDVPAGKKTVNTLSLDEPKLRAQLESRFAPMAGKDIDVMFSPELVYFDDRRSLRPAYRVVLSMNHRDEAPADRIEVFLPAVEPAPSAVQQSAAASACSLPAASIPNVTPIDGFAFDGEAEWGENAANFFTALLVSTPPSLGLRNFCFLQPRMLLTDKKGFVDSAIIALIESHGQAGQVRARSGSEQWVNLDAGGGYGAETSSLRLLILHSCSVIATWDDDKSGWYRRWFDVFKGLNTVVGYRTTMSYTDGVSAAFAPHLLNDEEILRSWFAEVAAVPSYGNQSGAPPTGGSKKYGRAAAVTVCGEQHKKRTELQRMLNPPCLVSYWMRDN